MHGGVGYGVSTNFGFWIDEVRSSFLWTTRIYRKDLRYLQGEAFLFGISAGHHLEVDCVVFNMDFPPKVCHLRFASD